MPNHLFIPDQLKLKLAGFGAVAHVPCIYGLEWFLHHAASEYLRERAVLGFRPGIDKGRYPTQKSLVAFGRALIDFLDWCEEWCIDWREIEYTQHLINRYQSAMLNGSWSTRGIPLAARTINARVQEACNFLSWAGSCGLRKPFTYLTTTRQVNINSARNSSGQRVIQLQSRVGRVRPRPATLRLPDDQQIQSWLNSVLVVRGYTKALMCELILKTGIRREEACQWRVDTLPISSDEWDITGDSVSVAIKFGAKGQKYINADSEEYGPERNIRIPLELAERLAYYRDQVRFQSRARYSRAANSAPERLVRSRTKERRLFLSEKTGEPISSQVLYAAWTDSSKLPFVGWSPHLGRHYWACKTILNALEQRVEISKNDVRPLNPTWVIGMATDALMLLVKPQLGHVSQETSNTYLVWLSHAYIKGQIDERYAMMLDDLPGAGDWEIHHG